MKNRLLSIALAILMLAALIPFTTTPALAASSYSYDEIIPLKYDNACMFSDGLVAVELGGKWGFIDKTGKEVIPFKYDAVCYDSNGNAKVFYEGLAGVMSGGKWGYIDTTGKTVIPFEYERINIFDRGFALVQKDGKKGIINNTGDVIVPFGKYDIDMGQGIKNLFMDGLLPVKLGGKWGFVDTTGKEAISCIYDDVSASGYYRIWGFSEGLAGVKQGGKWGYIDTNGKVVIPFEYDNVWPYSEGLAAVNVDGKWGVIDTTGKVVIPFEYKEKFRFFEGLAAVKIDEKYGFIDKTGSIVIQPKYSAAWDFENGVGTVEVGVKRSLIDKIGTELFESKYRYFYFGDKEFSTANTSGVGTGDSVIDKTGKEVIPPGKYDSIYVGSEGIAFVRKGEKFGYIAIVKISEAPNLDTASQWAKAGIQGAYDKGFIPTDLQSQYTAVITRAEFCRMAVEYVEYKMGKNIHAILADKGVTRNYNAFADTNDPYLLAAYALGITNGTKAPDGTTPGTFTPNGEFSREQAATMIRNVCKVIGMTVDNVPQAGYADIGTASSWAIDAINFCYAEGIMTGTGNNSFSPKGTYTRQESIVTFDRIK